MAREPRFGEQLRLWRRRRGLSQLELGSRADVSQRHISFLETGRSRASAEMVLLLAAVLAIAPREQNRLLLSAGHAPAFPERPLAQLTAVSATLDRILAAHEPHVAFVIDRSWNVLRANAAAGVLLALALPGALAAADLPLNVARASLHPDGLRRCMPHWEQSAARLLRRLERDAEAQPHEAALQALLADVRRYPDVTSLPTLGLPGEPDLLACTQYHLAGEDVAFFTTIMTIGDAVDLTLAELRLETFWPADPHSRAVWTRLVADQAGS